MRLLRKKNKVESQMPDSPFNEKPVPVKCGRCENWKAGYILCNDTFIPPKCGLDGSIRSYGDSCDKGLKKEAKVCGSIR